jgi:hypothetical protein
MICHLVAAVLTLAIRNFLKTNNNKAFEKLKAERLATEQRLQGYLDEKIGSLVKKCICIITQPSTTRPPASQFNSTKTNLMP